MSGDTVGWGGLGSLGAPAPSGGSSCSTWQLAEDGGEGMGPLQRFYHIWGLLQLHLLAASRTQAFMGNKGVWPGKTPPPLLLPSPPSSAAPEAGHLLLPQAAGISLPFFFNNHFIVTIVPILSSRPGWVWCLPPHVEASMLGKGKPLLWKLSWVWFCFACWVNQRSPAGW